ncbi:MAG: hypothetical protein GX781_04910, partial [Clostridiales bacterium]|nr:hypothetical protein [Clostridiales bacterium]
MKKLILILLIASIMMSTVVLPVWAEMESLKQQEVDELETAIIDESKELIIQDQFRINITEKDLSVREGLDKEWKNILLLGTDTGSASLNHGRTDTMIILSVNIKTGQMRLSSLVRDMQVNIPYRDNLYKINVANAFGGPLLAIKAVNETFGLNITDYCSVNFSGFVKIIDSLGGVELSLDIAEAFIAGAALTTEPQVLNGTQALEYVRIRKLDNNFGRNNRQRILLSSIFEKIVSDSNMQQITTALSEVLKYMSTNLTLNEVLQLTLPVLG